MQYFVTYIQNLISDITNFDIIIIFIPYDNVAKLVQKLHSLILGLHVLKAKKDHFARKMLRNVMSIM